MVPSTQPEKRSEAISAASYEDSFSHRPKAVLLDEKHWQYLQRRYHMSPRELEVARLVCQGFINYEIAKKLKVKSGTVKTHLRSIFGKTHSRNKITMLLRFVDDVTRLFSQPNVSVPLAAKERENPPSAKTTSQFSDSLPS